MKTIHIEVNDFLAAVIGIAAGVLLVIFPQESLNVITYGIGIISLVYGVLRIISYFRNKSLSPFFAGELFLGIVLVAIGLFSFLPIVLGILVLVEGISKLQRGLMLKNYGYQRWVAATVVAGCIIALGILLIFNPFNALVITMRVLGIVLAADGIAGLWVNFIIKRYYQ